MKKGIKTLFVILFIISTSYSSSAAEKDHKSETRKFNNYIAVFDFEMKTGDKEISRLFTENIRREIILSGKYEVIDRSYTEKILGVMEGCTTRDCILKAGHMLDAGKIISGTMSYMDHIYYLKLYLIDVRTGEIVKSVEDECRCEIDELRVSAKWLVKILIGDNVKQLSETVLKRSSETIPKQSDTDISAIAKPNKPEPKITNSIGMTFVYIKPGTFIMGSPFVETDRESDETQHEVTLKKGFYMQSTEVTQGQWRAVMGNNPSYFSNCGDDCPVEQVTWNDVQEFIRRLNQKEGVISYRLPTEAEWEYAARAGSTTAFNTGNCLSTDQANYDGNFPLSNCQQGKSRTTTVRVGAFPPNGWGLYDIHGNVWEWCQDWYDIYPSDKINDPAGPLSGSFRVLRGGSWRDEASLCRLSYRGYDIPVYKYYTLGFRLAKTR